MLVVTYIKCTLPSGEIRKFNAIKVIIRGRKSKDRQHNGQKKKGKKDKQRSTKHTHTTKDRVTRTPLKPGVNSCTPEG